MLTVDYGRLGVRAGDKVLDLGLRLRSARLPGGPAAAPRWWPSTSGPTRSATSRTPSGPWPSPASSTRSASRVGAVQGDALALPFADGRVRPGDRLGDPGAHPRRRAGHGASWPGSCGPAAPWPSPCPGRGPSSSTGPCRTSTTTCPAATSASTASANSSSGSRAPACGPPATTTPTVCTPRTGGSSAWSGTTNDTHPAVAAYHRLLVWDIEKAPTVTRTAERVLNPLVGKSLVVYLVKPVGAATAPAEQPVGVGA